MTPHEIYLSSPITQRWLRRLEPPAPLTPEQVVEKVCGYFNIPVSAVKGRWRPAEVVVARQFCMVFLYKKTSMTLKAIGLMLGGRDHSTVLHSRETISNLLDVDIRTRDHYQSLCVLLGIDSSLSVNKRDSFIKT